MTESFRSGAISRRTFVTGVGAGAALLGLPQRPLSASSAVSPAEVLSGHQFNLSIGYRRVNFTGSERQAVTVNGSLPGPILRWREGDTVTLNVRNQLARASSLHWHGIRVPSDMDGVPGLSFSGIEPGQTFRYRFPIRQSGTYWYHSQSGFQEQQGLYGAIVIDPASPEPFASDRDYVVVLSDWSNEPPQAIYTNLKKDPHYYNRQQRTAADLWREVRANGVARTWRDRHPRNWAQVSDRDIAHVTGETYTYLINGQTPDANWSALFKPGEKIRLRFINAASMTLFDLHIPALKMRVIAADGQNIEPVSVDEFRIGTGETYDVIVEPKGDRAYTLFAQTMDRSGYARGTLTADVNLSAQIPPMDHRPMFTPQDLGLTERPTATTADNKYKTAKVGHSDTESDPPTAVAGGWYYGNLAAAGLGSNAPIAHQPSEFGYSVDSRAASPANGLTDPGIGMRNHMRRYNRRVLTYADLRKLKPSRDRRQPERELQLHLTGNIDRYMWSINGEKPRNADPLLLRHGERLRITLVNDTTFVQPIHLHGLWSELETGDGQHLPNKHTILVQAGSTISYLVSADTYGRWALQCQMLYQRPGMFREVRIV
ncbi:copper resistance system multicopper oxidase [Microbulbifer sp. OS29]|uniref:Copper resistance system multicopper oxidase n=1 Tax=Microbulbifer okhotskensis TaxID=2926617 RepID=A0A9X2EPV7_9GAMM|nr:copper resistance system multicopper oxidase [Microbulbifer okhotskensis]MCO1335560.1 copper resistance system multicopper oxidase [Microbulbifer okhotskensis]